jgi:hypothetical protein
MPFLRRSQIPLDIRKPHADAYRDRLRQILLDPSLTPDQRSGIKAQIDALKRDGILANSGKSTFPV